MYPFPYQHTYNDITTRVTWQPFDAKFTPIILSNPKTRMEGVACQSRHINTFKKIHKHLQRAPTPHTGSVALHHAPGHTPRPHQSIRRPFLPRVTKFHLLRTKTHRPAKVNIVPRGTTLGTTPSTTRYYQVPPWGTTQVLPHPNNFFTHEHRRVKRKRGHPHKGAAPWAEG